MRKVLSFGTFDLLHKGHEYFLYRAKRLGDWLTVVVGTDHNVEKFKKRVPVENERERVAKVRSLPYVDEVLLGRKDHDFMKIIRKVKPEVICLGYDQKSFCLEDKVKGSGIEVIRMDAYKENEFKTSILRKKLRQ
jgi:FAD synthetase